MAIDQPWPPPAGRVTALFVSVALMMLAITWVYRGMRAVMDIGGACASGGPYVPVQPCPGGATALLTIGIFVMVGAALAGTAIAVSVGAPVLLLAMWWLLFGALGWNFIDYGVVQGDPGDGSVVWGWLICGVMFWLMAAPALAIQIAALLGVPGRVAVRLAGRSSRLAALNEHSGAWWLCYLLLAVVGVGLGWWTFDRWAT